MSESKSPKREFFLNSDVSASSLKDIILGIYEVNKYDDEQSETKINHNRNPIKIVVDSFGGECYSGMTLVNSIDTSTTPIFTFCYGKAMSMGLTIFVAGHRRFAHKYATFMQHQLSGGTDGKLRDMEESVEQKIVLQNTLDEVLIENSKIKKARLMELREKKTDWYFMGQEALELGVVDELIVRKNKASTEA